LAELAVVRVVTPLRTFEKNMKTRTGPVVVELLRSVAPALFGWPVPRPTS
jgi:hypothetical protein